MHQQFPVFLLCASLAATSSAAQQKAAGACALQTQSADELISRSPLIVLAEALDDDVETALSQGDVDLKEIQKKANEEAGAKERTMAGKLPVQLFAALDYLKGDGPARVSVALPLKETEKTNPEAAHDSDAFWTDATAGRASLAGDCRVTASFEPGGRYLLFYGAPHVKAFERVDDDDDKWLAYVREQTAKTP